MRLPSEVPRTALHRAQSDSSPGDRCSRPAGPTNRALRSPFRCCDCSRNATPTFRLSMKTAALSVSSLRSKSATSGDSFSGCCHWFAVVRYFWLHRSGSWILLFVKAAGVASWRFSFSMWALLAFPEFSAASACGLPSGTRGDGPELLCVNYESMTR